MTNRKSNSFSQSLRNALRGFSSAVRSEKNLRIHLIIAAVVVLMGFVLKINHYDWMALSLIIPLILIFELFNTAIEFTVDLVLPEADPRARRIKDIAAAAVLVASISAVILGILIFGPKLIERYLEISTR